MTLYSGVRESMSSKLSGVPPLVNWLVALLAIAIGFLTLFDRFHPDGVSDLAPKDENAVIFDFSRPMELNLFKESYHCVGRILNQTSHFLIELKVTIEASAPICVVDVGEKYYHKRQVDITDSSTADGGRRYIADISLSQLSVRSGDTIAILVVASGLTQFSLKKYEAVGRTANNHRIDLHSTIGTIEPRKSLVNDTILAGFLLLLFVWLILYLLGRFRFLPEAEADSLSGPPTRTDTERPPNGERKQEN